MNFDIKVIVDTREKDLSYIGEVDKRRRQDGTKIIEVEVKTCTPLNCKKSTSDITFEYKIDGGDWNKTSLAIEVKKGMDLVQSLSTVSKRDRLIREVQRAIDADLDFYFIGDTDVGKLVADLKKLEGNPRNKIRRGSYINFLDQYLKFNNTLVEMGFPEGIIICSDLWFIIRRLIKKHIKEKKLLTKVK